MEQKSREIRAIGTIERRDNSSRHVTGYAAVFNKLSHDLGGFVEIIAEGAFDGVVEKSDVFAVINHDASRGILARSRYGEGTLKLSVDEVGLKYEFDAPNTALGDELLEMLTRGDIRESSFAFWVADDEIGKSEDGMMLRTITRIEELFDVSPVYQPAYPDTTVAKRSIEKANSVEPEYYAQLNQIVNE